MIRLNTSALRPCVVRAAGISTSKKNKDTVNLSDALVGQVKTQEQTEAAAEKVGDSGGVILVILGSGNEAVCYCWLVCFPY